MHTLPAPILHVLLNFAPLFSQPVWNNAFTLLIGAILCHGKRTVTAALRMMGLEQEPNYPKYHWVLSHAKWSPLQAGKILLGLLVKLLPKNCVIILGMDETIERRNGKKIAAKGCYRDAVRSSQKEVVKCFGLKWMSLMIWIQFPWSQRRWALPVLTVLEPSEKADLEAKRKHKTSIDWAIQMIKQIVRWLPNQALILLGDGGFASAPLCFACICLSVSLVSRLRIDSRLYDFPPEKKKDSRGRPPAKGIRLATFKEMLSLPGLIWQEQEIQFYGNKKKVMKFITNTALWHVQGYPPIPIRWVLLVDPEGKLDSLPLFSTNPEMSAKQIIELFIERWGIEVTFEEMRAHMGMETQRQWSDGAILRTTPALMGIYSLVCVIAYNLLEGKSLQKREAAWYKKRDGTFSDVLALVREKILGAKYLNAFISEGGTKENKLYRDLCSLVTQLARAA